MAVARSPAVLCIGKNYADHAAELADPGTLKLPERPVLFLKNRASVIGNGAAIELPPVVHTDDRDPPIGVDYEGELAVILGCDARDVPEAQARDVIAAVACANDVSQRWWQWHGSGGQWCRGKSFDTFCPLGEPTPISTIADLPNLLLTTRLNGEVVEVEISGVGCLSNPVRNRG